MLTAELQDSWKGAQIPQQPPVGISQFYRNILFCLIFVQSYA